MGIFSFLAKEGTRAAAENVATVASGAGDLALKVRSAITGEEPPDVKVARIQAMLDASSKMDAAVNEVNKIEAASTNWFVAGWRPAIGWICAISLGAYYIPRFILGMTLWTIFSIQGGALQPLPDMGITDVLGLVISILGVGTLRTIEKTSGSEARR